MSEVAARFQVRSPRYKFTSQDDGLVRFASIGTKGVIFNATAHDISETGLSFTIAANQNDLPFGEGDILKVEFATPQSRSIACFATVVRIDSRSDWHPDLGQRHLSVAGLHFRNLPRLHRLAIRKRLESLGSDEQVVTAFPSVRDLLTLTACAAAMFGALTLMNLPVSTWLHFVRNIF